MTSVEVAGGIFPFFILESSFSRSDPRACPGVGTTLAHSSAATAAAERRSEGVGRRRRIVAVEDHPDDDFLALREIARRHPRPRAVGGVGVHLHRDQPSGAGHPDAALLLL